MEKLRKERTNLSQIEFAVHCGMAHSTYQRWVTGKTIEGPSMKQLKAMCHLLGIRHIDELPDSFSPSFQLETLNPKDDRPKSGTIAP